MMRHLLVVVATTVLSCGGRVDEGVASDALVAGDSRAAVDDAVVDSAQDGDGGDAATVCPSFEPGRLPCAIGLTCSYNFNCGFSIATHRVYWCDHGRFALLVAEPGCVDGGIR